MSLAQQSWSAGKASLQWKLSLLSGNAQPGRVRLSRPQVAAADVFLSRAPVAGRAGQCCPHSQLGAPVQSQSGARGWLHWAKTNTLCWNPDSTHGQNSVSECGVGVWIAHMTWHGAMPKILAYIHVVCQLICLPKTWSITGCDVNTQHLLGEVLDLAWCWPCWSSQVALYHAPQEQHIVQKSKILSVRRVPVLSVLTQHLSGYAYILC